MTRLGSVYDHRMVDVKPRSPKRQARAIGLVAEIGRVTRRRAFPPAEPPRRVLPDAPARRLP